ncbi:MAG: NAD(P)H-dependent oxidoreductase subunit E [Coriobacteriia bacterium]|nr:NAD(P)H-dependent oxidoreductase subunit E [Coriobacteriia bacterium]
MEERIREIAQRYPAEKRFSLAVLQDVQREFNYIPPEALPLIKEHLGPDVREGQLYALATFYKALSLKPKGKHIIKICDGTACHMQGSTRLITAVQLALGIGPGECTPDGQFSLELVNCVGSCALAPIMIVDETYHSKVTMEGLPAILDTYRPGGERDV